MKPRRACLLASTIIGGLLTILGFVIAFKVLQVIVDDKVADSVKLEVSDQYMRFQKLPFGLDFKIYFWNVKNPQDVMRGVKPIVEEVGPLWYSKTPEKRNIEHDGETISYKEVKFHKLDNRSKIEPDQKITILNVPLNAVFQIIEGMKMDFLMEALSVGYKEAFDMPESEDTFFHEIKAEDYAFRGYKFCNPAKTVKAESKFLCAIIRIMSTESMEIQADRTISFSFFKHKDGIPDGSYKIYSGTDDAKNVGEILEWNKKTYLNTWKGGHNSKCNKVRGTDSTIYPPYGDEKSVYTVFNTDICRTVDLAFTREMKYEGITGNRNNIKKDTLDWSVEDNDCYCIKKTRNLEGEEKCLPSGFLDMYNCLGAPVLMSFPHFLWADERYANTVVGLNNKEDDHVVHVSVEPKTGSPLTGNKRIQFNMILRKIEKIPFTQNTIGSVMPILWVDEGVELPPKFVDDLKSKYVDKLPTIETVKWVMLAVGIIGILMFILCLIFFIRQK